MPDDKNGKRDTQHTDEGYEIPVPKRKDVFDAFRKVVRKRDKPTDPPKQVGHQKPE